MRLFDDHHVLVGGMISASFVERLYTPGVVVHVVVYMAKVVVIV